MRSNKINVLKNMLGMLVIAPVALSLSLFAADPVHLWELDENDTNSTTYIDSIGEANGTCAVSHCPTPSVGQINGAQYFDATESDRIDVNNTTNFDWDQNASITIEFWMKSPTEPVGNRVMIGRANTLGILWYIGIDGVNIGTTQGHVRVAVANDKTIPGNNVVNSGNKYVTDDKWHHIAFVLTELEVKVYVDGVSDLNLTRSALSDLHANSDVNFGSLNSILGLEYNGNLDEITVYNSALDAGLIQQHYQMGLQPNLAEVTPVPTSTNDNTPDYTFSSTEAGTITYGGSCTSATTDAIAGDNTITFNTLADGIYSNCTITVTDEANNSSAPLYVTEFTVDTSVPDVTAPTLAEVTAVTSPTDDNTPDYTFSSDEAGTITYGGSCTSSTTSATAGNNTITFDMLTDGVYGDCTITVTDAANNASDPLLVSEFVVDTTVPEPEPEPIVSDGGGGGCTYNPNSKNFDMMFLLMIAMGLFYPFRRRFIK